MAVFPGSLALISLAHTQDMLNIYSTLLQADTHHEGAMLYAQHNSCTVRWYIEISLKQFIIRIYSK